MNINDYQKWTKETAVYPEVNTGSMNEQFYLALGLAGEAGEVSNSIKKVYRDGFTDERKAQVKDELSDVLWYVARLAEVNGWQLEDILDHNKAKLEARYKKSVA